MCLLRSLSSNKGGEEVFSPRAYWFQKRDGEKVFQLSFFGFSRLLPSSLGPVIPFFIFLKIANLRHFFPVLGSFVSPFSPPIPRRAVPKDRFHQRPGEGFLQSRSTPRTSQEIYFIYFFNREIVFNRTVGCRSREDKVLAGNEKNDFVVLSRLIFESDSSCLFGKKVNLVGFPLVG